jgi:hypothetical protein
MMAHYAQNHAKRKAFYAEFSFVIKLTPLSQCGLRLHHYNLVVLAPSTYHDLNSALLVK